MNNIVLLKLHRWITLAFSLPLLALMITGLIISFQPVVQTVSVTPGSVSLPRLEQVLNRYDPDGKARGLAIDGASRHLRLLGVNAPEIDLATGEAATTAAPLNDLFQWARRNHEHLVGQSWLVIASTAAMVVLILLGVLTGLPRLRNSLSGWHKGVAWFGLPLIVLSPLTGLCMAFGLTFTGPGSGGGLGAAGRPLPLRQALVQVAQTHDLAQVVSISVRGGGTMARLQEGGELRAHAVTAKGVNELPRNWPRLLHEGNWFGLVSGPLNVLTSLAMLGLLSTGLLIWARRTFRRRPQRHRERGAAAASVAG